MMMRRTWQYGTLAAVLTFACLPTTGAAAPASPPSPAPPPHGAGAKSGREPPYPDKPMAGPAAAKGAVVWSHGRSINSEDSLSPTPSYMTVLRKAGWDVFRFNRMRDGDTLTDSARELAADV